VCDDFDDSGLDVEKIIVDDDENMHTPALDRARLQ